MSCSSDSPSPLPSVTKFNLILSLLHRPSSHLLLPIHSSSVAQVTMKLPLTGQQYSAKVTEKCVAIWKSLGIYTDCEAKGVDKFLEIFKDQNFSPGASILFALSPYGSLTIAFSRDDSIPKSGKAVVDYKLLAEAVLESIIGKNGVSPAPRLSLAERLAQLMNKK